MKNALIIPYGTPNWGVFSDNFKNIYQQLNEKFDIFYILPIMGIVNFKKFHPSLVWNTSGLSERTIAVETPLMIRAWILEHEHKYRKVLVLNYGSNIKHWNKAIAKTNMGRNVRIIRYNQNQNTVKRKVINGFRNFKS